MLKNLIKLARVSQWIKNGFIFLPIFFAGQFLNKELLTSSFSAFFVFCFVASAVYVINDLSDVEKDKLHPEKRFRPIASGAISKNKAYIFLFVLILSAAVLGGFTLNSKSLMLIGVYFLMNIGYSFGLKNIAILDINIVAIGFLIRVFVGGSSTDLVVSKWAILLTYGLAMILVLGKRRGELVKVSGNVDTRKVLNNYNLEMLNIALGIVASFTITSYVLYTLSDHAAKLYGNGYDYLYLSVILVVMGIFRYLQQSIVFNKTESPTKYLYKDVFLQLIILSWVLFYGLVIYFFK